MHSACCILCKPIVDVLATDEVLKTAYVRVSSIDYPAMIFPHRETCSDYDATPENDDSIAGLQSWQQP